ncbi:MAG: TRAP transporter small permease [Spirochaetes bacterium]|nr:TRAP transporter small permease [Spirochaetota bacterium]
MNSILNRLFRVIEILIAIFLGGMILVTFLNVLGRNLFNIGFVWSEEIARLCFIFLVYLGSIEAMRDNRHLLIDTFLLKLPKIGQTAVYALTQLCAIYIMQIITRGAWGLVVQNRHNVWIATGFPSYIVHLFGCILGVSIILISIANLVRLFYFKIPVADLVRMRGSTGGNSDNEKIE